MANTTKEAPDTTKPRQTPPEEARRRGGQELPDDRNRQEQNRGRGTDAPRPDREERIDQEDDDEKDDESNSDGVVKVEGDEEG